MTAPFDLDFSSARNRPPGIRVDNVPGARNAAGEFEPCEPYIDIIPEFLLFPAENPPLRACSVIDAEVSAAMRQRLAMAEEVTMSAPFFPTVPQFSFSNVAPGSVGASMPDSFLGALINAVPSLLVGLAQTGVIRGSVGAALAPMMQQQVINPGVGIPAQVTSVPSAMAAFSAACNADPTGFCQRAIAQALQGGGMSSIMQNPLFFSNLPQQQPSSGMLENMIAAANNFIFGPQLPGGCGSRPPPMQAPSLFRTNACGRSSLPARQQIIGPDGHLYVIASLGKATRGSREESTMRRLAKQNGFTVARRGASSRAGRRRRPR